MRGKYARSSTGVLKIMAKLTLKIKNSAIKTLVDAIKDNKNFNPIDPATGLEQYDGIDLVTAYVEKHLLDLATEQIVTSERQEMRARVKARRESLVIIDNTTPAEPAPVTPEPGPVVNPGVIPQ